MVQLEILSQHIRTASFQIDNPYNGQPRQWLAPQEHRNMLRSATDGVDRYYKELFKESFADPFEAVPSA